MERAVFRFFLLGLECFPTKFWWTLSVVQANVCQLRLTRVWKRRHAVLNGRPRARRMCGFQVRISTSSEDGKVCIGSKRGLLVSQLMGSVTGQPIMM